MSSDKSSATGHKTPAKSQVKQKTQELTHQTKAAAGNLAQDAAAAAAKQADAAKSSVADEVSSVASALRTAAEEMRSGSPQERTFGQIAEGLADASDAMREKDLSTMVQDVSTFARKNPLVFLGGAVLIGFAATRFAKASNDAAAELPSLPYAPANGDYS